MCQESGLYNRWKDIAIRNKINKNSHVKFVFNVLNIDQLLDLFHIYIRLIIIAFIISIFELLLKIFRI